jgi:hypothetical protein
MEAAAAQSGCALADVPRERMEELWNLAKAEAAAAPAGRERKRKLV